jgi:hypothetical protein
LTSAGCCARAIVDSPTAAAPESTVRRVTDAFNDTFDAVSRLILSSQFVR